MKVFLFEDNYYIRTVPGKNLFKATMVHEVVNRGDIFAVRVKDGLLTIIPGTAQVVHFEADLFIKYKDGNGELLGPLA